MLITINSTARVQIIFDLPSCLPHLLFRICLSYAHILHIRITIGLLGTECFNLFPRHACQCLLETGINDYRGKRQRLQDVDVPWCAGCPCFSLALCSCASDLTKPKKYSSCSQPSWLPPRQWFVPCSQAVHDTWQCWLLPFVTENLTSNVLA